MTSSATQGIKTVLHPVTDLGKAKAVYTALLGQPPAHDADYYVGYDVAGQHIGLVPNGAQQGMASPVDYWHVPDINAKLAGTEQARAHGLTREALDAMDPIEQIAWKWVLYYEKAMDDIAGLQNCRHVLYEDVCRKPREEARGLLEFAGLSWSEQTGAFIGESTARESTEYYSVYKDPLQSAYKWKNELAPEQIDRVLAIVRNTRPGRLYAD